MEFWKGIRGYEALLYFFTKYILMNYTRKLIKQMAVVTEGNSGFRVIIAEPR
jgi:hypothetical protein